MLRFHLLALLLTSAVVGPAVLFGQVPLSGSLNAHDPSTMIKDRNEYYVFYTDNGVGIKSSRDRRAWVEQEPAFPGKPEKWLTNRVEDFKGHYWAPDIVFVNGMYYLYYSASRFGHQNSVIGVASARSLRSPQWKDLGPVIESNDGDPYNAIDPAILVDSDRRMWMTFGSYWKGIYLLELDPFKGGRISPSSPLTQLAWNTSIEAPVLYKHDDYYYLFVNFGRCCQGLDSTYEIRIGRSKDIAGPYLDRDGRDMRTGGGSLFLGSEGRYHGPGHAGILYDEGIYWFTYHFYDGERRGRPTMGMHVLKWSEDGWPEIRRAPGRE